MPSQPWLLAICSLCLLAQSLIWVLSVRMLLRSIQDLASIVKQMRNSPPDNPSGG